MQIKPLEKSENRFKPSALNKVELSEVEEVLKSLNRILNQLAKDNFKPLSQKLIDSLIDDEDVLVGTIELIYDKALEQPKFVELYAQLCNTIQRSETVFGNTVSFSLFLLACATTNCFDSSSPNLLKRSKLFLEQLRRRILVTKLITLRKSANTSLN